jgi:uncharacterized protein YxjI
MQQDTYVGGARVEPLSREVLTIEIREGRDLLSAENLAVCEPYVTVTVYDSTGRAFGSRKTNVVAGSLNPYWMERFEFHITQWDREGGYVEIALHDNRNENQLLGYIRQPLFRLGDTGAMEGWYFLDRARHPSAALYFRMAIGPYHPLPLTAADTTGLASGISGVGSRTALGTGVGAAALTPTTGLATPTPGLATGTALPRETAASQLYLMRQRFWGLSNTYEIKDAQGLVHYRLIGNFGKLDDIRIADATGHEVGFIREETSFLSRLYRMPTYLISAYGTSAKLKKKFLSVNEPIYALRPFNAPSIHAKGNLTNYDFSFYQGNTILADVSKGLAPPGDVGLYGIRIAPNFFNPLLIIAAVVAIDRINDVGGLRSMTGVYTDSKSSFMSRYKGKSKKKATTVATTATPVAATATATPAGTPTTAPAALTTGPAVPAIAPAPLVSPPIAVSPPGGLATTTTSRVYQTQPTAAAPPVTALPATTAASYGTGIPTTPVVSVTTVQRGGTEESMLPTTRMGPSAELAAREQVRQQELQQQQMMQAERVNYGQTMVPQQPQGVQQMEKEKLSEAEIRQGQAVRIPISGEGGFD